MRIAINEFIKNMATGENIDSCLYEAKIAARFSGSMRTNLLRMLDQCDIPQVIEITQWADLFDKNNKLLHTTSIIKYPVFVQESNYTGHRPPIDHSVLLSKYVYEKFPDEIAQINSPALLIPLGQLNASFQS